MMSCDILMRLSEILNNDFSYSPEINAKVINLLSMYSSKPSKCWIYPGTVKRNTGMDIIDVYKLLSELEQCGFVESWYEMCCGHCQRMMGQVRRFNELPETFECENCGETMQTLENTIKIYKALYDER